MKDLRGCEQQFGYIALGNVTIIYIALQPGYSGSGWPNYRKQEECIIVTRFPEILNFQDVKLSGKGKGRRSRTYILVRKCYVRVMKPGHGRFNSVRITCGKYVRGKLLYVVKSRRGRIFSSSATPSRWWNIEFIRSDVRNFFVEFESSERSVEGRVYFSSFRQQYFFRG